MEKRKIILDCDPGHDDAIAMMMAAKHPAIDLLGITIVAGDQNPPKTIINGLDVLQKTGNKFSVFSGGSQTIMRQQKVSGKIYGENGLGGPGFEPPSRPAEKTPSLLH
ncbi:nucleoside hydrolase, partial [Escherichia coli]|nr:nucleoside hydrolase [Escherichia coli]